MVKATDLLSVFKILFGHFQTKHKNQNELISMICYPADTPKKRYINSMVFSEITNTVVPVHVANIIFNCFDPYRALYIYKKAPAFINIEGDNITRPSRLSGYVYYIILVLIWLMIVGPLYVYLFFKFSTSLQLNSITTQLVYFFTIYGIIALCFIGGVKQRIFLAQVESFYKDLNIFEEAERG